MSEVQFDLASDSGMDNFLDYTAGLVKRGIIFTATVKATFATVTLTGGF